MSLIASLFKKRIFRICMIWLVLFLLCLGIVDYHWETHGIPDALYWGIRKHFTASGMRFEAEKIRVGVWNGIVCTNLKLSGGELFPSMTAAVLRADFAPSEFFKGTFLPLSFEIEQGTVSFPLFPEYGKEALYDNLVISGVDATVSGMPGIIKVHKAEGSLNGIRFSMSGTIDNLLHYSGVKGVEVVKNVLAGQRHRENKSELQYIDFLKLIPLEMRRKTLYTIQRMNDRKFTENPPSCVLNFHIDITDFKECRADAAISIPAFTYGNLKINSIQEKMTLKDGILALENVRIDLTNGTVIEAHGRYDGNGNAINGSVKGKCRLEDIVLFLDDTLQDDIAAHVKLTDEFVSFDGMLNNFSLSGGGNFSGSLNFFLQHIVIGNIELSNARMAIGAEGGELTGSLHSAELRGGGSLSGSFAIRNDRFACVLNGKVEPMGMKHFFSGDIADFVYRNIQFQNEKALLAFSGTLESPIRDMKQLIGNFKIKVPEIYVKNVPVKEMTANLTFTSNSISASALEAVLFDGSRISGNLYCLPAENNISASIVCSGSPHNIISALGTEHQDFVKSLTRNIGWPKSGNYVEAAAELHVDYGKDPFYYMAGSIVIRDFSYENIPFKYGAARFIIDAANNLILPDAVLETKDGKMSMSASYKPSGKNRMFDLDNPRGKLNFSLSSTMAGNDMIRSLYPLWKSEFIDFPYPIKVESSGVIDYENTDNTHFDAVIANGSCEWHKMSIKDIDTILKYEKDTLSFQNASGVFCGGRLQMDYSYDFKTAKGTIASRLSGANMQGVLENFSRKKTLPEYRNGVMSADFRAKMSYNAKDELLLDGNGHLEITGSNLWTVPLFGSFLRIVGQVWSLDSFGSITRVACDYKLKGDRLVFETLKSDGGFISLDAHGFYCWEDNQFDLRMQAKLLKNTLPFDAMSRLLIPVSWILDKRLKGDFNTFKWE